MHLSIVAVDEIAPTQFLFAIVYRGITIHDMAKTLCKKVLIIHVVTNSRRLVRFLLILFVSSTKVTRYIGKTITIHFTNTIYVKMYRRIIL